MEPTEKQLTDFWLLIEDYTGETTVGERMRRAWKFVEYETGNAMYLAQAHRLCTELGISQGHIEDRLFEAIGKARAVARWASCDEEAATSFQRGYDAARRWIRDVQMISNVPVKPRRQASA